MSKIYDSMIPLIGKTPLVELQRIGKECGCKARILAKLEYLNPAGSVKDRIGLAMIEDAEAKGILKSGMTIVEPTSGNTGIGLAMVAAIKGYFLQLVMPETMSVERRKLLKAYGAKLVLTEGAKGMKGAIEKAKEIVAENSKAIMLGQFDNLSNPQAHRCGTGPEIYEDTDGKLDIVVAGVGTGGTVTGIGEFLKGKDSTIQIVAVEPVNSPVLSGGAPGKHGIQGIGAGFVPNILNTDIIDEIITVNETQSYDTARLLATKEGVLLGISSGAALYAAIDVAKRDENVGKTIVVVLPDSGDRYLSTTLYE